MADKQVIKKLVDPDTGEFIEIHSGDKLKIISEDQRNAITKSYKSKQCNIDTEEWNKELGGFVFALFKYSNTLLQEYPELNPEDITKLFYLATFVDYNRYLVFNGSYLDRQGLNLLLNIHISTFDEFFNKMKKLNIMEQDENKKIKINNTCFSKGELDKDIEKNYDYTRIYINTIRYLFENVPLRKHKQLGNYFKLIPYIHRQQNVLCWNPESKLNEIKLMHVRELQEILGYHRNGVRGFIKELLSTRLDNNEAILGFFRTEYDEGKSYVIVNPKVFYGGNFNFKDGRSGLIKWFIK
jgi:hypothetical protein